ncbi:asparaginase [Marinobacterium jannaschii]|uniref:asparaginase n=1 Tax=Marinobacterium jannaschii TaxID=64970 RepID=UPI000485F5B0|nr:asparaginase [Marinobacterium jannaschii]
MSKKILVIYTGGTIGMQASDSGYVAVPGFEQLLRNRLDNSHHALLPEFEVLEYEQLIDSANLRPDNWRQIASSISDNYARYDGFIVLHGTDTMAFTASALSFMLQGLGKPVILTGSQIPLSQLRNDALDNMITALLLAGESRPVNEVCVYFNGRLLRGNRASKVKATGLDAFDSPNFPWLGQVGIHIELHRQLLIQPAAEKFQIPEFDPAAVAILQIYPGMPATTAAAIINQPGVRAVIIQSYGVGNLPDADAELIAVLREAAAGGIQLLNLSRCLQAQVSQGAYACSAVLNEIGVISGGDMTLEAAFAKLHLLLATESDPQAMREQLQRSLAGEISLD